jgi:outer membrane protein
MNFRRKSMKKQLLTALFTTLITTSAQAWQSGDILLRAGAAGVYPTGDGSIDFTDPNAKVEADDAWSLGISLSYMVTNNIGVGVLGAWPFKHDIKATGDIANLGKIGETKQLPPTVTLQYHFDAGSRLHPYVGAGINYTNFFSTKAKNTLDGASLDLSSSWGLAGELGLDYELGNDWMVGGQVFYIDIDTDAKLAGVDPDVDGKHSVSIDPWVYMISVGRKF